MMAFLFVAVPVITHASRPSDPVITREVFVHYPRGAAAKPNNTTCPDPTTCADYKLTRLAWQQSIAAAGIHYNIDPTNSGLSISEATSAIDASFTTWSAASAADADGRSIAFVNDGVQTIIDPNVSDSVNSLTWRNLSSSYSNAIAVTFAWHYLGSKEIIETDTVFNTAPGFAWSTTGQPGEYDLQNIGTHEFGHWLQLGDLYTARDQELTMYGYGATGETKKQTFGLGDTLGVQKIY